MPSPVSDDRTAAGDNDLFRQNSELPLLTIANLQAATQASQRHDAETRDENRRRKTKQALKTVGKVAVMPVTVPAKYIMRFHNWKDDVLWVKVENIVNKGEKKKKTESASQAQLHTSSTPTSTLDKVDEELPAVDVPQPRCGVPDGDRSRKPGF